MCNEIVYTMPKAFHGIPDRFKTQNMCKKAVEMFLITLRLDWRVLEDEKKFFDHLICLD